MSENRGLIKDRQAFFDNADAELGLRKTTIAHREVVFDEQLRKAAPGETQDARGRPIGVLPDTSTDSDPGLYEKSVDESIEVIKSREQEDGSTHSLMGASHRNRGGGGNRTKFRMVGGIIVEQVQQMGAKACGGGGGVGRTRDSKKRRGSSGAGAPTIESEPRTERRTIRMTETTLTELVKLEQETGVNFPGLVAAISILRKRNDPAARFAVESILRAAPLDREPKTA